MEFIGAFYLTSTIKGNIRWAAPELFEIPDDDEGDEMAVSLSTECDIYSFGSIALQVLTCKVPYYNVKKDVIVLGQVIRGKKPVPPKESQIAPLHWEFIQRCWLPRASRPSVREIVSFVAYEREALVSKETIIRDFTSQIYDKLSSPVTTGSFGIVYRCTIESSERKTEVAVKVFKVDPGRTIDKLKTAMLRELKVWLRLKHSTIVPLLGTAQVEPPLLALISQWMTSGTLYEYLKEQPIITTPSARIKLAKGIAEGLSYLHSENVIHGDLHPGNVLIDSSGNPCLTDFGLATVAEDPDLQWTTTIAGGDFNPRWRAPESDIYSFGSVMFFVRPFVSL
ncbi:hypothetical protein AZE42_09477 [Rhizopogon vesiculosus]|uniref:Protein kinase domain-containing protein n=1 Tax=Rhizopogon vesiculosus TaxID=180088 RepID=A0A1J8PY24_9AGAM|nr:hypothetical protein AZE42_09477 [Rhizopogon vesiculosus]